MSANGFDINLLETHWLKKFDDPDDLCAHGKVYARIGSEVICDNETLEVTVSAAALYLMRTVDNDYKEGDFAGQLLPCCGHSFFPDGENDFVIIVGCGTGIDWTITHSGNKVIHTSKNGSEGIIDKDAYRVLIFEFADQIKKFYQKSLTKKMPYDEYERKGYAAFWREWEKLRVYNS